MADHFFGEILLRQGDIEFARITVWSGISLVDRNTLVEKAGSDEGNLFRKNLDVYTS